ncbi:MAG: hypothetical protein WC620_07815 [Methanoregula sp.]|jgi:hypothetical protein
MILANHKRRSRGGIQDSLKEPLALLMGEFGLLLVRDVLKSQGHTGIPVFKEGGDAERIEVYLLIIFLIRNSWRASVPAFSCWS